MRFKRGWKPLPKTVKKIHFLFLIYSFLFHNSLTFTYEYNKFSLTIYVNLIDLAFTYNDLYLYIQSFKICFISLISVCFYNIEIDIFSKLSYIQSIIHYIYPAWFNFFLQVFHDINGKITYSSIYWGVMWQHQLKGRGSTKTK